MDKNIWWAAVLRNCVSTICFTILAIYFGKWWIVFFAAFFLTSVKTKSKGKIHRIYCSGCGKSFPLVGEKLDEVRRAAIAQGWYTDFDNEDICPECRGK